MADTLEIFGVEYTNVAGIIATNNNDTDLTYIRPQGTKSITQNGTGIDVASFASVDVNVSGGGQPTLQSKTYNVSSAGTATVTADSGYDGLSEVEVDVPSANYLTGVYYEYYTDNNVRKWHFRGMTELDTGEGDVEGWLGEGTNYGEYVVRNAIPTGTSVTPTESSQTVGGANYMMEGAVTVNAISSNYVGSGITRRSSSDLTASGATVTVPAGYYSAQASKAVASGTEGTPTATKGTVSNHSISVTPSVTNTTGYITGSTKTGTAVTVTASELASGNKAITQNGTNIDVVGYSTVSVDVQGGGSSMGVDLIEGGTSVASTLSFTGLKGEPTTFAIELDYNIATGTPAKIAAVVFDGTNLHAQTITNTANAQVSYTNTGLSMTYSNGTLTVTSTGASFVTGQEYFLSYSYGGGAVDTKDVQVGSGATSITFTGLEQEPTLWSCIFKSNFSTSSGYQRVIFVEKLANGNMVGFAMDSQANLNNQYWTASYNNGSMTITSQGTNQGGYFHQPGYYQLTYAYDDGSSGNYQNKTVTPTTSIQEVTADTGYDALKKVTVNAIPSNYIIPTGNINITSNTATGQTLNVAQYATATVAVPSSGSSKNSQTAQSTTRSTSTTYTECISLTCAKAGTYDVYWSTFRSSTSGTWGSQLYLNDTAYGTAQTGSWSNHIQNIHLSNVQISANAEVAVRVRSRGSNYYGYVGTLTIIEA